RPIEGIEELRPELDIVSLVAAETIVLEETSVPVANSVDSNVGGASRRIAKGESGRAAEDGSVKPMGQPGLCAALELRVRAVIVGPVGSGEHARSAGISRKNGSAALKRQQTGGLPSRNEPAKPALVFPGQLRRVAHHQPVRRVERIE